MTDSRENVSRVAGMLVYVVVFTIILGMVGTVLVVVLRFTNQEIISVQVNRELNGLLDSVQELVSEASSVECVSRDCSSYSGDYLKLRFAESSRDPTCVFLENGVVKVAEGSYPDDDSACTSITRPLTTSKVVVYGLDFTLVEDASGEVTVNTDAAVAYNTRDTRLDFVLLGGLVIVGVFLIKSILNETKQKRLLAELNVRLDRANTDLKDLNEHLEQKVAEQTLEVRQAYEVEKKARVELEELDRTKDQFILTTQHHLRTPLTIIKGYLGVVQEDSSVKEESKEALEKISQSTETLSRFVNELIQVTELKTRKGKGSTESGLT